MVSHHSWLQLNQMYCAQGFNASTVVATTEPAVEGRMLLSLTMDNHAGWDFHCTSGRSATMCSGRTMPLKWALRESALVGQILLILWVVLVTFKRSSTSWQIILWKKSREDARQDQETPCRSAFLSFDC
jgi:hypothetical protein